MAKKQQLILTIPAIVERGTLVSLATNLLLDAINFKDKKITAAVADDDDYCVGNFVETLSDVKLLKFAQAALHFPTDAYEVVTVLDGEGNGLQLTKLAKAHLQAHYEAELSESFKTAIEKVTTLYEERKKTTAQRKLDAALDQVKAAGYTVKKK